MTEKEKTEMIETLQKGKADIDDRIKLLEQKERDGTITNSSMVAPEETPGEAIELNILKDNYDLSIFDTVIELVNNADVAVGIMDSALKAVFWHFLPEYGPSRSSRESAD